MSDIDRWWDKPGDAQAIEDLTYLLLTQTPLDLEESEKLATCAVGLDIDWARTLENAALWRDSIGVLHTTLKMAKMDEYVRYGASFDAAVVNAVLAAYIDFGPDLQIIEPLPPAAKIFDGLASTASKRRMHLDTNHPRSLRRAPRVLGRK